MAELEFAIPSRQCLHRHLPDQTILQKEIAAWEADRNRITARPHRAGSRWFVVYR
jgi:hypothetical protein